MTTARTKAATTSASFGTRILTQCIPGLASGGCAESKRNARECGLKTRGLRSTSDLETGKFYQRLGKTCGPINLTYIGYESAFCISVRPPYNARRQHGSCVLQSVPSCLPRARGQRPAGRSLLPVCSRIKPSFSCPVFLRSLSLSATKSHFRFQHQIPWARKSSLARIPPPDRVVISTRRQSDTSASPSRTNEISTSSRLRFNGEALASPQYSCHAKSCGSTSIELRLRRTESIVRPCTTSCVSRRALLLPSFAWLSSCAIW